MIGRAWVFGMLVVLAAGVVPVEAQENARQLSRELARLIVDDSMRRAVDEQVGGSLLQALAGTLQERLHRRLLEIEVRLLTDIVGRFVRETLPPGRVEDLAADVYARHFDEAELRELLRFHGSDVGKKAARLRPAIAAATTQAIDRELRASRATPSMMAELQLAFPVLGPQQSP